MIEQMIKNLIDECELEPVLARVESLIDELAPGPVRDQLLGNHSRFRDSLVKLPAKIASRGPFRNIEHFCAETRFEIDVALRELIQGN
jgi:hypothetical protein